MRKDKEIARLRREIEALRAQVRSQKSDIADQQTEAKEAKVEAEETTETLDTSYLKRDLLKTFTLTILAVAILFALYFTQPQWPQLVDRLSSVVYRFK